MANPEQLKILKQGVAEWNKWRVEHHVISPELSNATMNGADLSGANLGSANLRNADLRNTNLRNTRLCDADLSGANLNYAKLHGTNLEGSNLDGASLNNADLLYTGLSDADLSRAHLIGANFNDANLSNTKFIDARIGVTTFVQCDLSTVVGLDRLKHAGPSSIGIDSNDESKGRIPHAFLRGAGVPDTFIQYMASLTGGGIEFHSCFISYSTKDQEFAERLHADLQSKGVRCWFAPHDMTGGKKIHEQIDEAIRVHDKLLLILSPSSMESEWVKTEISKARKREIRDSKRVLFPVRLTDFHSLQDWECFDADTGKDYAREIREYFMPDFSDWKDYDSYQEAFTRLLKDLKAETTK